MHHYAVCILNIGRTCVLLCNAGNHDTDSRCAGCNVWDVGCGQFPVAGAQCHAACGLWHMRHVSYVYHVVCDVCNLVHGMVCSARCMWCRQDIMLPVM